MDHLVLITRPEQVQSWEGSDLPWPYRPDNLIHQQPDAHWIWLDAHGRPEARCSLWWRETPAYTGDRIGLIGHYAASGAEAARGILEHACQELGRQGRTLAIGPVDGNTWRRYRLVTERGARPAFFLEPDNPADWPVDWTAAGFRPMAEYHSRLCSDLSYEDPRGRQAAERLKASGVRLRSLHLDRFEQELERLYPMLVTCFRSSLLYSPISREAFVEQYLELRPRLRPELVTVAEHGDQPVGLLFAIPDFLQAARGKPIDTAIIKTLAISSERAYAGLGSYLTAHHHSRCRELGYRCVIHALMHQSSKSQNISARYGSVMRRYALFGRAL